MSFVMKNSDRRILLIVATILFCFVHTNAQDSTTVSHELKELVVKDKRAWIENDKIVFIPTKREKNLSNSPETLLEVMHLPMLLASKGTVKTLGGENVVFFINGIPASQSDLSTFWPKRVKQIEYMPNSSNPRFGGIKHVINFISEIYEVGSITNIEATQYIPNDGDYEIASRLEYKRMSFGLLINPTYSRDHMRHESGNETYSDLYYENEHYDEIERTYNKNSYKRNQGVDIYFDARYLTEKTNITHSFSLKAERNPSSGYHSSDNWTPYLFASTSSLSYSDGKSWTPQISGSYYSQLSQKWYIHAGWGYSHAHNENNQTSAFEPKEPVLVIFSENVNSATASIMPIFQPSRNLQFRFYVQSQMDWFDAVYAGSSKADSRQRRGSTTVVAALYWQIRSNLSISIKPGIVSEYWKINSNKTESDLKPKIDTNINWSLKKFFINGNINWYSWAPKADKSNNLLIKTSDLLWLAGNPYLKTTTAWDGNVSLSWMAANWFNTSINAHYSHISHSKFSTYKPAAQEFGGLIKTEINGASMDDISTRLAVNVSPCNKLNICIYPSYNFSMTRLPFDRFFHHFTIDASCYYSWRNFGINCYYRGVQKSIANNGSGEFYRGDSFDIELKYGDGNLYVNVGLCDIFHKFHKQETWTNVPYFSTHFRDYQVGRRVYINVSYKFGFGKEVEDDSVSKPKKAKTSMLSY